MRPRLRRVLEQVGRRVPVLARLLREREQLARELFVAPGHFYSPIPSREEVTAEADRIFAVPRELAGIRIDDPDQLRLLEQLSAFSSEMPFSEKPSKDLLYGFDNPNFRHGDASVLYAMIRRFRPRRIIEVGSGYSSCVILDTLARFPYGDVSCAFIEPHPRLLRELTARHVRTPFTIVERRLQEVDIERFLDLRADDLLFIDSSHVLKTGSDVHFLLFEILPRLAAGVLVHIHDVFWPFEYPCEWVKEGRAWNEAYALRAFLHGNDGFAIILFNDYLARFHARALATAFPQAISDTGGSLWMRRQLGSVGRP